MLNEHVEVVAVVPAPVKLSVGSETQQVRQCESAAVRLLFLVDSVSALQQDCDEFFRALCRPGGGGRSRAQRERPPALRPRGGEELHRRWVGSIGCEQGPVAGARC